MEEDSTTDGQIQPGDIDENITTTEEAEDQSAASSDLDTEDNAPSDSEEDSADDKEADGATDKDAPAFDKDLDSWAEKAGLGKLETDKERKLAQIARDNQREFSKRQASKAQADDLAKKAAEVSKTQDDDDEDPMVKRLNALDNELATERQNRKVSEFFGAMAEGKTPVTDEEAQTMSTLLEAAAKDSGKAGVDFLLNNISRWHKLAKLELSEQSDSSEVDEAAEKARLEERQRLAKISNSKSPAKSAKSINPAKQKDEVAAIWEDDNI